MHASAPMHYIVISFNVVCNFACTCTAIKTEVEERFRRLLLIAISLHLFAVSLFSMNALTNTAVFD